MAGSRPASSLTCPLTRLPPLLRQRDFTLYLVGNVARIGASQIVAVGVGWQVYAIHRNPFDLGLIGLAEFLPVPLLALPFGQLADRYSRRLVVAVAIVLSILPRAPARGHHRRAGRTWPFLLLRRSPARPARSATPPPEPCPRSSFAPRIGTAFALRSTSTQFGIVAGPAAGGFLFAQSARASLCDGARAARGRARRAPRLRRGGWSRHRARRAARALPRAGRDQVPAPLSDRPRRDPARPLRRALRRSGRAAAGVRSIDPPHRPFGPRPAAKRPGGGSDHRRPLLDATAAGRPTGPRAPRDGDPLRRRGRSSSACRTRSSCRSARSGVCGFADMISVNIRSRRSPSRLPTTSADG